MIVTASEADVQQIVTGRHHNPFSVLGGHAVDADADGKPCIAIRAFLPEADSVAIVSAELAEPFPAVRIDPGGFFEAVIEERASLFAYKLRITDAQGNSRDIHDPYSFWPVLTDFDIHLFGEGTFLKAYDRLGAHLWNAGGVEGVLFAVWAPNASRVSVVGNFNGWDGRRHPMRSRAPSGIWEIFLPELGTGEIYKYEIRSRLGDYTVMKSDPFAFHSELRPKTASIVCNVEGYPWRDQEWMERRSPDLDVPMSVYEVHLGSWRRHDDETHRWLSYRELADQLPSYAKGMGFTHVELLPVNEHPFDGSWGYQTTGYFAPTSRFGTPADFQHLVDACHREGIGVILDWVPAHFPMDEHGLRYFDGTHLYEHADPRLGEHQDWGTAIFNFGRTEVRNFLISNALFWLDKYHIDGLRVDAVASMLYLDYSRKSGEWLPNRYGGRENLEAISFLKDLNTVVHDQHPGVLTIAEESTAWPGVSHPVYLGGLGFSLKWNMGWMHDMLSYFSKDSVFRKYHHNNLTFALMYAFTENFVLVFSHDEVVHMKGSMLRKMPGDDWQKFANLRALYGLMYAFPGKKMLFMGDEWGQWDEWDHDRSLDWHLLQYGPHRSLQHCVRRLNQLHRDQPQLHKVDFSYRGFEWIDFADSDNSIISFLRKAREDDSEPLVVVGNFTPVPRLNYRLGVPYPGMYEILLNTDAGEFGGSGIGNTTVFRAENVPFQNRPYSLSLLLPPLSMMYLKRAGA